MYNPVSHLPAIFVSDPAVDPKDTMCQFILTLSTDEHLSPAAADIDHSTAECPVELKEQFCTLRQQYGPTCFKERECPPFPPDRGPENLFQIHLDPGEPTLQPSQLCKMSPGLIEGLQTMLLELLQTQLI